MLTEAVGIPKIILVVRYTDLRMNLDSLEQLIGTNMILILSEGYPVSLLRQADRSDQRTDLGRQRFLLFHKKAEGQCIFLAKRYFLKKNLQSTIS